jgi:predicted transcriptional regulator
MKRLDGGRDVMDIINDFESDQQLVQMWMMFLQSKEWIEKPDGKWLITEKGKEMLKKYDSQP